MTEQDFLDKIRTYNRASKALVGKNIRRLLEPYKVKDIAQRIGISEWTIRHWLKHGYNTIPEIETALALCVAIGKPFDELIKDVAITEIDIKTMQAEKSKTKMCKNGCNKPVIALGLCHKCYQQQRRAKQTGEIK